MEKAKVFRSSRWSWLDKIVGSVDCAFAEAACDQPPAQKRPELDFFGTGELRMEDWEI